MKTYNRALKVVGDKLRLNTKIQVEKNFVGLKRWFYVF